METNSKMKTFNSSTLDQEFSQWPMLDQTLMVHNSFFALSKLNGSTERLVLLSEHQSGRQMTDVNFQHVVFGSVVEGMDVVKKVESVGSQSGRTSRPVKIADCGQL